MFKIKFIALNVHIKKICKIKYQIFKEVMSILNIFFQKIKTISKKKFMSKGNCR